MTGTSTNVGRYKHKTYKRRTVQTSDQYKRQTSTNIGPIQKSETIEILVNSQFSLKKIPNFFC